MNRNSGFTLIFKRLLSTKRFIGSKQYSTVLMRGVPSTLTNALSISSPIEPIDIEIARSQHRKYLDVMNNLVPNLIELKADDLYPDCVFIEDTAVVVDNNVVICKIGAKSRRGEVDKIKEILLKLGYNVKDMRFHIKDATCDGGDVLYPVSYHFSNGPGSRLEKKGGKHLFVGISSRTNLAGAEFMQQAFPHIEVIPVNLGDNKETTLHLKSAVTHIDAETLLIPTGSDWDALPAIMGTNERNYNVIRLPDIKACNVVSVCGTIIARPDVCDESKLILQREADKRQMELVYVDTHEFSKADGALTCKSILLPI